MVPLGLLLLLSISIGRCVEETTTSFRFIRPMADLDSDHEPQIVLTPANSTSIHTVIEQNIGDNLKVGCEGSTIDHPEWTSGKTGDSHMTLCHFTRDRICVECFMHTEHSDLSCWLNFRPFTFEDAGEYRCRILTSREESVVIPIRIIPKAVKSEPHGSRLSNLGEEAKISIGTVCLAIIILMLAGLVVYYRLRIKGKKSTYGVAYFKHNNSVRYVSNPCYNTSTIAISIDTDSRAPTQPPNAVLLDARRLSDKPSKPDSCSIGYSRL